MTWLLEHWLFVLTLAMGFVALWLLLPQPRKRPVVPAATLGLAATIVGGMGFLESTGRLSFDLLFFLFSGTAVVAGVLMITQRNPVYAALWFAIVILSTCGLFLLLSAPFLAAATIIIYAGAIIVTFLFVIMLAQQTGLAGYDRRSREPLLAALAGFVLLGVFLFAVRYNFRAAPAPLLEEAGRQLSRVQGLLTEQAPLEELGPAMQVEGQPIGVVLRDAAEAAPLSERRRADLVERIDLGLGRFGAAKARGNHDDLVRAFQLLQGAWEEIQAARRTHWGLLPTDERLHSALSQPQARDAGHVAGLGRSLFSDYLWAVELAGTILLAATAGTIAIAMRRKEAAA